MMTRVKYVSGGWVLAGGLFVAAGGALAQSTNGTLPDAQVESNVLRALAGAPDLSTQNIQTATVYGAVTISGNVHDEGMRTKAENLVARTQGVKKVVDQLTLGDTPAPGSTAETQQQAPDPSQGNVPAGQVLMSDGTYGPASGAPADNGGQNGQPMQGNAQAQGGGGNNQPPPPGYNQNQPNYNQPGYNQQAPPQQGRQPLYANNGGYAQPREVPGGQHAGMPVTIPAGAMLRIRINRGLTSQQTQPGTTFDGTVLTDVIADGAVAIPRGATVQGTVLDAKKAGVFKGEGSLALQLTTLQLGGSSYSLNTQVWTTEGRDKTAGTVNRTVGTSAFGAIVGALAGGGEGAAIGAGVGAGAGLASSAAGPRGQVMVPPESVLTFATAQPTPVRTVSEAEMQRLSYAAGPGPGPAQRPPMRRYYSPYYGYYYGPAY